VANQGDDPAGTKPSSISIRIKKDELRAILEFDRQVRNANGVPILSPEGRLLLRLALDGAMSVSAAQIESGTSPSGYFNVLRRLKAAGLVNTVVDKDDARVKWLHIGKES
jgi:DNA-binding MarR family transcriptional regulator